MNLSLENYHVFIAGGLGDFGYAISKDLVSKGADITILYNSDKNLNNKSKYNDNKFVIYGHMLKSKSKRNNLGPSTNAILLSQKGTKDNG